MREREGAFRGVRHGEKGEKAIIGEYAGLAKYLQRVCRGVDCDEAVRSWCGRIVRSQHERRRGVIVGSVEEARHAMLCRGEGRGV